MYRMFAVVLLVCLATAQAAPLDSILDQINYEKECPDYEGMDDIDLDKVPIFSNFNQKILSKKLTICLKNIKDGGSLV